MLYIQQVLTAVFISNLKYMFCKLKAQPKGADLNTRGTILLLCMLFYQLYFLEETSLLSTTYT